MKKGATRSSVAAELIQDAPSARESIHHLGGVPSTAVNAALLKVAENASDTPAVVALQYVQSVDTPTTLIH